MNRHRSEESGGSGRRGAALLTVAVLFGAGVGGAVGDGPQDEELAVVTGERLYREHCAKCHGETGAGDGQLANWLDIPPSDLTVLSRENGGVFPFAEVLETIDGSEKIAGHDSPDMPIWREVFRAKDRDATREEVSQKLRSLTTYVGSLQVAE